MTLENNFSQDIFPIKEIPIAKQETRLYGKFKPPPSKIENKRHFIFIFGCCGPSCGPSGTTVVYYLLFDICIFLALEDGFWLLEYAGNFCFVLFPDCPSAAF